MARTRSGKPSGGRPAARDSHPRPLDNSSARRRTSTHFVESGGGLLAGGIAILAAILVAYGPALAAGFVWDDDDHFTENPLVVGPGGFGPIWTSSSAIYYPLVLTTWRILHSVWGLNPLPYHLLTILLHVANALLLWALLRRLAIPGAWLAAALFALHPVHVESVAWATELKNTQSGLFYLLSIFCFIEFHGGRGAAAAADEGAGGGTPAGNAGAGRGRAFYAASLLLFALALLSKPSTVMLPAVLLLIVWWQAGRWRIRDLAAAGPFFLLSLLSSAWTIWEQKYHSNARGVEWSETLLERVLNAGRVVWFYLGKLFWPHPLVFIHPRWTIDARSAAWLLPLLALLAAGGVVIWKRRSWGRPFLFAGGYFVLLLFPVLGFFNIYFTRFSYVADHFQYLASMGILALAAAGVALALRRLDAGLRPPAVAVCASALLLLGVMSWRQTQMYKDEETLWLVTLSRNPAAWIGHNNLGLILARRGDYAEAEERYREAIRLKPDYEEAFCNLAIVCVETGRFEDAARLAGEAIRHRPEFAMAYDTLATAQVHLGRVEEAVGNYAMAVKHNPGDAVSRFNLATALTRTGRDREAVTQFEAAVRLDPRNDHLRQALALARQRARAR